MQCVHGHSRVTARPQRRQSSQRAATVARASVGGRAVQARVLTAYEVLTYMPDDLDESEAYGYESDQLDLFDLTSRLEARVKALVSLEEAERQTWPMVRVRVQCQVGLGDVFKVCGGVPELGRFRPEVAPAMKCTGGSCWTFETRVRPGRWAYKLVLRAADGAYLWEEGPDRVLEVPMDADPEYVAELVIDRVVFPTRR